MPELFIEYRPGVFIQLTQGAALVLVASRELLQIEVSGAIAIGSLFHGFGESRFLFVRMSVSRVKVDHCVKTDAIAEVVSRFL